jgi:hypothetical protein
MLIRMVFAKSESGETWIAELICEDWIKIIIPPGGIRGEGEGAHSTGIDRAHP